MNRIWSGPAALRRVLVTILAIVPGLFLSSAPAKATSPNLVISQVYGGGGNAGAVYTHDFIEIHNRSNSLVSVSGWTVQYASATGSSWSATVLSGSIPAGGYYLVREAIGAGGTTPLPPPDALGSIAMSATAGKVALVNGSLMLSGACPLGLPVVDLFGYGTANCSEGTVAAALTNTTAALRGIDGCTETDNNATDFSAGAPAPRNSATTAVPCEHTLTYLAGANGSITGAPSQTVPRGGSGTAVTPMPNANYHFVNWSDGKTDNPRTDMNVTADINVTANFALDMFTLVVNVDPAASGSVSKSPNLASYPAGSIVQLTATPADGYHFDHWSGGATGSSTPLSLTVNSNLVVTAHFLLNAFAGQMLISQVFGGGGDLQEGYKNDYVELYNRGNAAMNVTGWTIQHAQGGTSVWNAEALNGTIQPGHYYLIRLVAGGSGSIDLPTADAVGGMNIDPASGKVALVSNGTLLTGNCPLGGAVVDFLGYGTTDCSETSPAAGLTTSNASFRNHDGCDETNHNLADFSNGPPAPRNSASPVHICDFWVGVGSRPNQFALSTPKPNPSRGMSRIALGLPVESRVRLTVSDVMGRRIASLVDGVLPAGQHDLSWSGVGDGGPVRSGLYYLTLDVPGRRIVRSFVLMR